MVEEDGEEEEEEVEAEVEVEVEVVDEVETEAEVEMATKEDEKIVGERGNFSSMLYLDRYRASKLTISSFTRTTLSLGEITSTRSIRNVLGNIGVRNCSPLIILSIFCTISDIPSIGHFC